jgi:hypothetical protein
VSTIYKRKAEKVRPVDDLTTDGSRPGSIDNWKEVLFDKAKRNIQPGRFDCWLTLRFSDIPRGSRLTPERIEKLIIGLDLTPQERELLIEILFCREKALAFEFTYYSRIR